MPFFKRGWDSVVNRSPNMWTLISLGVGAAYLYSLVATFLPGVFPEQYRMGHGVGTYFEAAVVIVGGVAESGAHAAAIRDAAQAFAGANGAALCRIPQGANALGLAQAGVLPSSRDARAMLDAPRSGYLLYGIEPGDPRVMIGVALSLLAIAVMPRTELRTTVEKQD